MHLLPSDIARLVLGYLKENGLKKTLVNFLQESPDLGEYWRVLNSGQMPTTTVMGHSLKNILEDYAALTLRVQALNARLAQSFGASTSHDNVLINQMHQSDIDAVLECHRKAEQGKQQKTTRQKSKRRSDSRGNRSTSRTESSSLPQTLVEGAQSQTNVNKKNGTASKSSEPDDLDDDFEFDSLDRLLADTKLHEKLAESINKALKRDQEPTTTQLVSPSVTSKKNNSNQSDESSGSKDKAQKDTSIVVDDIINEPGLEQLLSLFQFQPEATTKSVTQVVESENKSAPLYIPDIGSNKLYSNTSLAIPSTSSDHACISPSNKDTPGNVTNAENVDILGKHSTSKSQTAVTTNNSDILSQSTEILQHHSSSTDKLLSTNSSSIDHNHETKSQSLSKDEVVGSVCSAQAQEQSEEEIREIMPTVSTIQESNTSLSNLFCQKEPSSTVKPPSPAQHFRKPRVKRCPKKISKEEEVSIHKGDHRAHLNKETDIVGSDERLKSPGKEHAGSDNIMADRATHSVRSQSLFVESQKDDSAMKDQCLSTDSPQNKGSSRISAMDEPNTNAQSHSSSHNAHGPPQIGMDENSLSVFSLINKYTAEINGEAPMPRHGENQECIKDDINSKEERKANDECDGSKQPVKDAKESHQPFDFDTSFKIESSEENEQSPEKGHCFRSRDELCVSSNKEAAFKDDESLYNGNVKQHSKEETPSKPDDSSFAGVPEEEGGNNYDSDSSFDDKISTPNAVYVKPVNMSASSNRENNFRVVDTCLQDILGKMKASKGEPHSNASAGEKERTDDFQQESSHGEEDEDENMEAEPEKVQFTPDKGSCSNEQAIERKLSKHNFHETEGLFQGSATISTPFVIKNIVNADNSPRKLVQNNLKNSESISMPASFPSMREECKVNGYHKPNEFCSPSSPTVSKFHPKSKENCSPIMSIPQFSRKVIACNIGHSPFVPSHLKKRAPSRRITPMEVSYSTPSPLGLMSPSSPAEFIIDLAQSPRTPARESRSNPMGNSEKESDDLKEKSQISSGLELGSNQCRDGDTCSESFKGRETIQNIEKLNDTTASPATRQKEGVPSSRDQSSDASLPTSPSQRKPRRIVPTLLSTSVSKVGGDSLFSSSSCSQNTTIFHQDEFKIVSSSSDPASRHSEAEAFRQLKNLIFHSYTKPQPNQEITSSNGSKVRYLSTPSRKCGCGNRDVCTHVPRLRHSSTPMRKCGCVSRDVCTHVKGKGRKLLKKRSSSLTKSKDVDSNISKVADECDVAQIDAKVIFDMNNGVSHKEVVGHNTESSLSSGAFIAVGTMHLGSSDEKLLKDQNTATMFKLNSEEGNNECNTDVHTDQENLFQEVDNGAQQTETGQLLIAEQGGDVEKSVAQEDTVNDERKCDSDNGNNNDGKVESGGSKGNSRSSNGSLGSIRRSAEFDHHDNISLAAPYFPELSNTFDFFKLKNQNVTEAASDEGNNPAREITNNTSPAPGMQGISPMPGMQLISPMPGMQAISPMPGMLHIGGNQPINDDEAPLASSCLISQAMEQCGIPFEPGEQTLMGLSQLAGMNNGMEDHNVLVDPYAQGNMSVIPVTQEPQRMQLRTRRINTTKPVPRVKTKRNSPIPFHLKSSNSNPLLPLHPSAQTQPQIILPPQSPTDVQQNMNPPPMTPGTVAYFSQPNKASVPFTILADGRVIILSGPSNTPPPPPPNPFDHIPHLIQPAPAQPVRSHPVPVPVQPVPTKSCSKTNVNKSVTFNSKTNSNQSNSLETKKNKHSSNLDKKKKKSHSSSVPKKDREDSKSTNTSKKDECSRSLQKVATRRKISDIASSPKKSPVSTYFQKSKKRVKRKLSLAAKISDTSNSAVEKHGGIQKSNMRESSATNVNSNVVPGIEGMDPSASSEIKVGPKDTSVLSQGDTSMTQPLNMDDETLTASEFIAMMNGDSPTHYSTEDYTSLQMPTILSPCKRGSNPSKTADTETVDSAIEHHSGVTGPSKETTASLDSVHIENEAVCIENENGISKVEKISEEKERILKTLSLKKKESHLSFSSDVKGTKDEEKPIPSISAKERSATRDQQLITDRKSNEIESSSHETESGNSLHGRLHSTPVDENFFDNLESMPVIEDFVSETNTDSGANMQQHEKKITKPPPSTPQKRNEGSSGVSHRKSFSDVLKSVSLRFTKAHVTPRKSRSVSSDEWSSDDDLPIASNRRKRGAPISYSSSSFNDSSEEEMVESNVSYAKVIKDKTISITGSDDGDIIKDVSSASVSLGLMKRQRRVGSNHRNPYSECENENTISPVCGESERESAFPKKETKGSQNTNISGDQVSMEICNQKEILTKPKEPSVITSSDSPSVCDFAGKSRKRKVEANSSQEKVKNKRRRAERFISDASLESPQILEQDVGKTVTNDVRKNRNLFNDIFTKKDLLGSDLANVVQKNQSGLELLSSVALLSDQALNSNSDHSVPAQSHHEANSSVTPPNSKAKELDIASNNKVNGSDILSGNKAYPSLTHSDSKANGLNTPSPNKAIGSKVIPSDIKAIDSDSGNIVTKKLKSVNAPVNSESSEPESNHSPHSAQKDNSHPSVASHDAIPSPQNAISSSSSSPAAASLTLVNATTPQSQSTPSPNISMSSSQLSSGTASKSISKKKINKLISKLYKAPPPP